MDDLAQVGGLASGLGTLFGGVGGFLSGRSRMARHLARCEDRLVDLESTVGVLLSILPGGQLAQSFDLYRRDADAEVAQVLEDARSRFRERNNLETETYP